MTDPAVSVVILTWNDGGEAMNAAASALRSRGVRIEVIVVDNASYSPFPEMADVRVLRMASNIGVGGGRNRGVQAASHSLVCVLDSDATLEPEALARLVVPFDHPAVGITGPVYCEHEPEQTAGRAPTLMVKAQRALGWRDTYRRVPREPGQPYWPVDFVIGACQVFRREVWERTGGIDESATFGPEDVDFCLRARSHGYVTVQVADVGCHHVARRSHRRLMSRRGLLHTSAVMRHLWRHRGDNVRSVRSIPG